jgi:hypothetical protein
MQLKPQDVLVAVKLALTAPGTKSTYPALKTALEMSLSEVHAAVKRATAAGLITHTREANRAVLVDFLVQGISNAFPPRRGPLTRGMPTAHGAAPLNRLVGSTAEPPPVWPDPDGTIRGETFEPLYPSVPRAAKKDPRLYQALCLIDAIRAGRSRDRAFAEEHLRKLILPTIDSAAPKRFSLDEPRRKRIVDALTKSIGDGTAAYYRSAIKILALEPPVEAASHLAAHLATEIESSIRQIIAQVMVTEVASSGSRSSHERCPQCNHTLLMPDRHASSIRSALAWLDIPVDAPIARDWLGLAGKDNDAGLHKRRHREYLEPPRTVDSDFWERFEDILDGVLGAFEKRYSKVFDRLDQLLEKPSPSEKDAEALRGALPQTAAALGYFFGRLNDPAWIVPLDKVGVFSRTPDSIQDLWPALQYLARMAALSPAEVAEIALAIPRTENIEVRATLAQIARELPGAFAHPFADEVDAWLTPKADPGSGYRLTDNVLGFLERLVGDGSTDMALRVLGTVLRPTMTAAGQTDSSSRRYPEIRLAAWDLRETVERLAPTALALGESGLEVVAQSLHQALDLTSGMGRAEGTDDSQYWCPDLESHAADYADDLSDHLVSLTRDIAVQLVDSTPSCLVKIVSAFEGRRWIIFRRLALFLLRKYPFGFPALVSARLVNRSCFDLPGPEYAHLLRSHFRSLGEDQQRTILSWIEQGPSFLPSADPSDYADHWKIGWLGTIADALPEDWRSKCEALKVKTGHVSAMDEVASRRAMFVGPTSPYRKDALAQMAPAELVSTVESWSPSSEFGSPEPEGLSRTLASIVEQKPDIYAEAIDAVRRLDPTYLRGFLSGFGSAARAGRFFDWKPVVDLCAWTVSQPRLISRHKTMSSGFDAHWGAARQRVLLLLSTGLTSVTAPIPVELRTTVWSAIEPTLDDPDDAEGIEVADHPIDHLLNRVQGLAMITAVEYALWAARGDTSKELPQEVKTALEKKIRAGSVAVGVALADRIGTMAYLDSSWIQLHVHELFKANEGGRDLAWETYLQYERLTLDAFQLLRWRYGQLVNELRPDADLSHRREALARHAADHLGRLYWHGQLDFDDRDKLLDRFFANAPATITGQLIEDIGHWLHTDGQPDREVLARLKALWQKRAAIGQLEELAAFGWWFSSGCFEQEWGVDNYLQTLKKLEGTRVSARLVPRIGERLAELIPHHLGDAVSCLAVLAKANENGWVIHELRSAAHAILAASLATSDDEVQKSAMTVISLLARRGYHEFRDKLL